MTEPRIRDLLSFVEAERDAAPVIATELEECAQICEDAALASAAVGAVASRLRVIATALGCKLDLLDRLAPRDDSEDTAPIIIRRGSEECTRCSGTGEVPSV